MGKSLKFFFHNYIFLEENLATMLLEHLGWLSYNNWIRHTSPEKPLPSLIISFRKPVILLEVYSSMVDKMLDIHSIVRLSAVHGVL